VGDALERLGIVVEPERAGWVGRCPAHDDRKPSWHVRDQEGHPRNGLHHCWSCGFGGNLAQLAAHVLKVDLAAAREWLRGEVGDEVAPPPVPMPPSVGLEPVPWGAGFDPPKGVLHAGEFDRWKSVPRAYAEARGLDAEQVGEWGIGYAVDGRLAGRIVIPVLAHGGRWASYMARDFTGSPTAPRYLYPRGEERPDLGVIFGECWWPVHSERDVVVVGEGALKALAVDRAWRDRGERPVAAIGGAQPSAVHVAKLASFRTILILEDPNEAGRKAAGALEASMQSAARRVARVTFPEGKDADTMPRQWLRDALDRAVAR
jgi:DNA primase